MRHAIRFRKLMNFENVDRLPRIEWAAYWDKTLKRWQGEGLNGDLKKPADIREHFGLDVYRQFWIPAIYGNYPHPASHGAGIIGNEIDYESLKQYLYPDIDQVWEERYTDIARKSIPQDAVVWITLNGFFWFPRTLFGIENHLYAFYDEPELMHHINRDLAEHHLKCLELFCDKICVPHFMTFAEDMSYNHGPMISKVLFDEFMSPYYNLVIPFLKDKGIKIFIDSDGDVEPLIPWFQEAGIEGILPLERMAGVDVARIRKKYPDWLMIGGFDKMIMKNGREAMKAEFERLLPVMKKGGYIPSVDHQTPPDVSLENYRIYLELLEEYSLKACEKTTVTAF